MKDERVLKRVGQRSNVTHVYRVRPLHPSLEAVGHSSVVTQYGRADRLHPSSEGGGHNGDVTQMRSAAHPSPSSGDDGQRATVTHEVIAIPSPTPSGEVDHADVGSQENTVNLAPLIAEIRELRNLRNNFMRARIRLGNQMFAVCNRLCDRDKDEANKLLKAVTKHTDHPLYDVAAGYCLPLMEACDIVEKSEKHYLAMMKKAARKLPVWAWAEGVSGFGDGSLGQIIGETGDLFNYDNPSKLWKRMGMAVIDGVAQRRVTGAAALDHGYSPLRRSIMWNTVDSLLKNKETGYRDIYLGRLAKEHQKAIDDGLIPATTTAATVDSWRARGLPLPEKVSKIDLAVHRTVKHMDNRARRYVGKRLLRHLWNAWRDY